MIGYEPAIDLDADSAIDMHVHVESDAHGHLSLDEELMDASAAYFKGAESRTPTVDDLAERYRAAGLAAAVFTVDATTATGHPALSSEQIAADAVRHNDVLIPFGSVDPHQGQVAFYRARRLVEVHSVHFDALDIDDAHRPAIVKGTAARVLGLSRQLRWASREGSR